MNQSYYLELIGRQLAGELEPEQERELMAWVAAEPAHRQIYDEITRLWSLSDNYESPSFEVSKPQAWQSLEQKLDGGGAKVIHMGRWLRYAAAVLVMVAAGYWAFSSLQAPPQSAAASFIASVQTKAGEQLDVQLPDGSTVVLNERTLLRYDTIFENRNVELSGEAFFDVARDEQRPFTIQSEGATTTVLGTSFNVRAYPEEEKVAVSVKSGKVSVRKTEKETEQVLLTAGESGLYDKPAEQIAKAELSNALAWKTQELQFDGAKLAQVAADLNQYFGVTITIDNRQLLDCRFSGNFKEPELEYLLEVIAYTMDIQVEQQNGAYVLKGTANCN
jgi:ferric-dicitrate binding protein FerR (iron transport regulator)